MSRFSNHDKPSEQSSPEVVLSIEANKAAERMVESKISERRRAIENSMGACLERKFLKHADLVEYDNETGIETLKLVKEIKLGEWTTVTIQRGVDDEGTRITSLSTWKSISGNYGWG